ncbi:YceI family protein [Anaerophaga thermohalophila]|uniref:YceI family protein n=1 Tax=Anaerophaga thermohalophila TaxID=177400 RepID=UPI000237CA73|nr:YceI family protein [Anaerophaga thermohalophila]
MIKSILKNELILALFIVPQLLTGQNIKLTGDNNSVKASGTSTLHDWEMDMTTFDATAQLENRDNGSYIISEARFSANANDLSSEKSMMRNKAHEALKAEKHPEIKFEQTGNLEIAGNRNGHYTIVGNLTIAGETKPIEIALNANISPQKEVSVSGETTLKMTDFDVEPPTVMFGTIKTADEVTINFNLTLK